MSQENTDDIDSQEILEWLNYANTPHTELVQNRLPQNITFLSNVGTRVLTSVFIDQRMTSRLNFQFQININEQHQQIFQDMPQPDFNGRMSELANKMTCYDINWNWQLGPNTTQRLQSIRISKFIDSSGLTRDRFYQTLSRVDIVGNQVLRELQLMIGGLQNPTNASQQNQDDTPSFIS